MGRSAIRSVTARERTLALAIDLTLAAAAFALALASATADAGPGASWQPVATTGGPPPARAHAAIAYDRSRHRLLLFAGQGASGNLDDTWELDLTKRRVWRDLSGLSPTRPQQRFSVVAGIDSGGDRLLVTTGQGSAFYNDVWSLDLASHVWTLIGSAGTPPAARYGSGGSTFDPGGYDPPRSILALSHGFTNQGRFQDSWSFDLARSTWSPTTPTGTLPVQRCLHAAALAALDRMILFGGCASGFGPCPLGDTWLLDLTSSSWTPIATSPSPSPRTHPSLAAIGDSGDLLLFGGTATADRNDVWLLDGTTSTWSALAPTGTAPGARNGAGLVWVDSPDPSLDGGGCGWFLLFGGQASGTFRDDLWELLPARLPPPRTLHALKRVGGAVELVWEHDPAITMYEAWRRDAPVLAPGASGLAAVPGTPVVSGGDVTLSDAAPPPAAVLYYRIRHARCSG